MLREIMKKDFGICANDIPSSNVAHWSTRSQASNHPTDHESCGILGETTWKGEDEVHEHATNVHRPPANDL